MLSPATPLWRGYNAVAQLRNAAAEGYNAVAQPCNAAVELSSGVAFQLYPGLVGFGKGMAGGSGGSAPSVHPVFCLNHGFMGFRDDTEQGGGVSVPSVNPLNP